MCVQVHRQYAKYAKRLCMLYETPSHKKCNESAHISPVKLHVFHALQNLKSVMCTRCTAVQTSYSRCNPARLSCCSSSVIFLSLFFSSSIMEASHMVSVVGTDISQNHASDMTCNGYAIVPRCRHFCVELQFVFNTTN